MNTSNSDNLIVASKLPHRNVQHGSSFNTHITLQKVTYTESRVSISYERAHLKIISEEISFHQNPANIIDHTFHDNRTNLVKQKKKRVSHLFILSMKLTKNI